ncbi:uncharacterized protein [Haliotis asinina]|uniref:uncharacterized protein n=1 Tax=Haliotis asinina TaxID=109174 RepID=UPI003531857C
MTKLYGRATSLFGRSDVNRTIASTLSVTSTPLRTRTEPVPIKIPIPYIGKTSHQINRLLKQQAGIETTFSTPQTLTNLLQANGRNHSTSRKSNLKEDVVYKIDCNCGQSYIGGTSRPINTRVKEHQASTNKSDNKSAISEHIQSNPNHQINWTEYTLLSTNQTAFIKRKLTEAIHLERHRPRISRDHGYFIPSAYDELINEC